MTVLEYKSPLDRLTFDDFDLLRVYRLLTKRKYKLKKDDQVWAVSLTSQFEKNYAEYVEGNGYGFKEIEPGVWGHEGDHDHFYWLDLATIGQRYPESFINLLRPITANTDIRSRSRKTMLISLPTFREAYPERS